MLLNKFITFVYEEDDSYDPVLSETIYGEKTSTDIPCNISDLTEKESKELFGKLGTQYLKARIIYPYSRPYHYVMYEGEKYVVVSSRFDKVFYLKACKNE